MAKIVTEKDKQIIIEKYPTTDTEILAEELGFKPSTIKLWAQKLKVRKQKGYIFRDTQNGILSKEDKKFIYQFYSTKSNEEISGVIGKPIEAILHYACSKGLKKRPDLFKNIRGALEYFIKKRRNADYNYLLYLGNQCEPTIPSNQLFISPRGKYQINQCYFDNIDNEWKAYWLGFLYADGWNTSSKNIMGLRLCEIDKEHIFRFKKSLQCDNKVYFDKPKQVEIYGKLSNSCGSVSIMISNKHLTQRLSELGCIEHKTAVLQFPDFNIVPEYLMRHFIRGFFDGDGWVSVLKNTTAPSIGFVGMESFIIPLSQYLISKLDLTPVKHSRKKNAKTIEIDWCSLVDVERIFNFLYNDSNIFLQRKFDLLNKFYCLGQYEV